MNQCLSRFGAATACLHEVASSQLVGDETEHPRTNGHALGVDQHAGVAVEAQGAAVRALELLLGLNNDSLLHGSRGNLQPQATRESRWLAPNIFHSPAAHAASHGGARAALGVAGGKGPGHRCNERFTLPPFAVWTATVIMSPMVHCVPDGWMHLTILAPELSVTCATTHQLAVSVNLESAVYAGHAAYLQRGAAANHQMLSDIAGSEAILVHMDTWSASLG